jgi:hypothetical protein
MYRYLASGLGTGTVRVESTSPLLVARIYYEGTVLLRIYYLSSICSTVRTMYYRYGTIYSSTVCTTAVPVQCTAAWYCVVNRYNVPNVRYRYNGTGTGTRACQYYRNGPMHQSRTTAPSIESTAPGRPAASSQASGQRTLPLPSPPPAAAHCGFRHGCLVRVVHDTFVCRRSECLLLLEACVK